MTLQEFFRLLGENPSYILIFFTLIPLTALLANFMGKGEGNMPPWSFLYAVLIYLVCIPGIFAFSLSITPSPQFLVKDAGSIPQPAPEVQLADAALAAL